MGCVCDIMPVRECGVCDIMPGRKCGVCVT